MEQDFLSHLNFLTRDAKLSQENFDIVFYELAKKLSICLNVERINIWLFNKEETHLKCIGNYIGSNDSFSKGDIINKENCPYYFNHLLNDEIIFIENVYTNKITEELADNYCIKYSIKSMMDVPIRIEGKLAGVLCYEDTRNYRTWNPDEQYFALAVNQIVSLSLEVRKRRNVQKKLEKSIQEKNNLLKEMHHRIKNNLTMLISIIRSQSREINNSVVSEVIADIENKLFSISKIHEQLYKTNNYFHVHLNYFLNDLVREYQTLHNDILFELETIEIEIDSKKIISIGLICNEILSNSIKHAFQKENLKKIISLKLSRNKENIIIEIKDNGSGVDINRINSENSTGMSLIESLSNDNEINFTIETSPTGLKYILEFNS